MNIQPAGQPKSSSNEAQVRKGERQGVSNKVQSINSHPANTAFIGEAGSWERTLRDRFENLKTCKIGHLLEVHLQNGYVYSGRLQDGIVLAEASLIEKEATGKSVRTPPIKTVTIPANEIVFIGVCPEMKSYFSMPYT